MYFVIQIPNSAKHNATQNNFANETLFLHKIITNKANKSIVNINGHTLFIILTFLITDISKNDNVILILLMFILNKKAFANAVINAIKNKTVGAKVKQFLFFLLFHQTFCILQTAKTRKNLKIMLSYAIYMT